MDNVQFDPTAYMRMEFGTNSLRSYIRARTASARTPVLLPETQINPSQ